MHEATVSEPIAYGFAKRILTYTSKSLTPTRVRLFLLSESGFSGFKDGPDLYFTSTGAEVSSVSKYKSESQIRVYN